MYKLFVVRFNQSTCSFDDEDFIKFCEENNIVSIDKQFFNCEGGIYYSFFVEYIEKRRDNIKPDISKLSEEEQERYNKLREWRNELAVNEGVPPYIIMYNKQIYDLVKKCPKTKSEIESIKGLKSKTEKYGKEILKILYGVESKNEE